MAVINELVGELCDSTMVGTSGVARVCGVDPHSVHRWRVGDATPRRRAEERILELRSVVDLLNSVMASDAARMWLHAPNSTLGYEKPIDLVTSGEYRQVTGCLLAIAEGVIE